MDAKGELIFRPRGYYYVLETLSTMRMKRLPPPRRPLLEDTIPEDLVKNRVCVASMERHQILKAPRGGPFIQQNYICVGNLAVAGKVVPIKDADRIRFDVPIPADYRILADGGPARGKLDGRTVTAGGDISLGAGPHDYEPVAGEKRLVVIWAQAYERGFKPVLPAEAEQP